MMELDYSKIVEDFDVQGLTQKKITAKFIRDNFENELIDLRVVLTMGNGDSSDNEKSKQTFQGTPEPEIINQTAIQMSDIFMGQEMSVDIWLGFVKSQIKGQFIKTVNDRRGVLLVSYDKTEAPTKAELFSQDLVDIPEKEIVAGIKKALKEKIKNS